MIIQIDTRQKMNKKHHKEKEKWFTDHGYEILRSKLAFGDYAFPGSMAVVVDTKQSCSELYSDLIQDHVRFRNECELAQKCGSKLYIIVENEYGFTEPRDIVKWKNTRYSLYRKLVRKAHAEQKPEPKPPATNVQLLKIMHTMNKKYGVEFVFCSTAEAGQKIIDLLSGKTVAD